VILELTLQVILRFNSLRKNQQARGFAIQSMNNEDFLRRTFRLCTCAQKSISRPFTLRLCCHGEYTGGLIDNDDGIVFIDYGYFHALIVPCLVGFAVWRNGL